MAQLPINKFKEHRGTKEFRGLVSAVGMDTANQIAKKHTKIREEKEQRNDAAYLRGVLKGMNIVINFVIHDN